MKTELLQSRISANLKKDLKNISVYKGISVSALVSMALVEKVRQEKAQMYTENGLTIDRELEILQRSSELDEEIQNNKVQPLSANQLLTELNA